MTRDKHKTITIITLLFLSFAIIFAFSKITFNPNLNANNNGDGTKDTPPPFSYVNARNSLVNNVVFENNFGGSREDEFKMVYNLDFYYIIGNTKSSDYYFNQNDTNRIFIIKMTQTGNAVSIVTTLSKNVSYVSSYLTSFGIYILCQQENSNNSLVYFYSFSSSGLSVVLELQDFISFKIIKSNNLMLIGQKQSKLCVLFYNESTQDLSQSTVNTAMSILHFAASYKSGVVVFINNNNSFSSYYVNESGYSLLYFNNTYQLINFQINSFGYLLLLNNDTNFMLVFLNTNFEQNNQTTLYLSSENVFMENINNNIYLIYKNAANRINVSIFSSKGDSVFNLTLSHIISKIFKVSIFNSNLYLSCLTQENNLKLLTLSSLAQVLNDMLIPFNSFGEVVEMEQTYDQHFMVFGQITANNTVIKHNFGMSDIFVFKLYI